MPRSAAFRSATCTPGRTYSSASLRRRRRLAPDMPGESRRDDVAAMSSPSGRSNTDGLEPVERLAHVEQQPQVHAELGDGLEGAEPGLRDERTAPFEQPRHLGRAQALRELVRVGRLVGGREGGAVPGRVARAVAELAERGGPGEVARHLVAAGRRARRASRGRGARSSTGGFGSSASRASSPSASSTETCSSGSRRVSAAR